VANFHHKSLKKFNLSGTIHDESATPRLKTEYVRLLVSEMRLSGYVPRIDIEPDFTIDYNSKKKYFEFEVTVYGVHVGKKQSECILAVDGHKAIFMMQSKSKESLQDLEQIFKQN